MSPIAFLKRLVPFAALAAAFVSPSAGDAQTEEPATTALATSLLAQAQSGRIDRTLFTKQMNDFLTADKLASVSQQLASLGTPTSITFTKRSTTEGYATYDYLIVWPALSMNEQFSFDGAGKIAGLFFQPATPVQTSTAEEPAITALATSLLEQVQSGKIDRTLFASKTNDALTPTVVDSVTNRLGPLGKPANIAFVKHVTVGGYSTYEYTIAWKSVSLVEQIAFDRDGKIVGWFFKPTT